MLQTNQNSSSPYTYTYNGLNNKELKPEVFISVNKNRIKHYKNKDSYNNSIVYLKDKTSFQLELFNPTQYTYGAEIVINGINNSGYKLLIRPGQRIFLDRFLDKDSKFIFNTYEVSGNNNEVKEAIKNNGLIKVSFYKEKESKNFMWYYANNGIIYSGSNSSFNTNITCSDVSSVPTALYSNSIISQSFNDSSASTLDINTNANKIETGRIEYGNKSNQKLESTYADLNWYADITYEIKILPESQKILSNKDIIQHRNYCSNCGKKVKAKDKFCSNCGNKL